MNKTLELKKLLIITLTIIFIVAVSIAPTVRAYGEESTNSAEEAVDEASTLAKEFNEKWLPLIESAGVSALSILACSVIFIRKIKGLIGETKKSKEAIETTNADLKDKKNILENNITALESATSELEKTKIQLAETNNEITALSSELTSVKEMIKIGFCNNSELVKSGYATNIARVAENEKI